MLPTCQNLRCLESGSGKPLDYCSQAHKDQALQTAVPVMQVLDPASATFQDVKAQFEVKWTKTAYGVPIIQSIGQIAMTGAVTSRYNAYRHKLATRQPPIPVYGHGGPGNEQRRFHGTGMKCKLGLAGHETLCSDTTCAVCGIIRTSFLLSKAQSNISFARFGAGTYFTSTSSKCHDYNERSEVGLGSGLRATFMCQVMIGLGCKLTQDDQTLRAAPPGYDSVLGETGDRLNYDELVVYDEAAAMPKYLVIYRAAPPGTVPAPLTINTLPTCKLPGCNKHVHRDAHGQLMDYCSKGHASLGAKANDHAGQSAQGAQPTSGTRYVLVSRTKIDGHEVYGMCDSLDALRGFLQTNYSQGYSITGLTYHRDEAKFFVVMRRCPDAENYRMCDGSASLGKLIQGAWDDGWREIVHACYGQGKWVVVFRKQHQVAHYKWCQDHNELKQWVSAKWQDNQANIVTCLAYGEGKWFCGMALPARGVPDCSEKIAWGDWSTIDRTIDQYWAEDLSITQMAFSYHSRIWMMVARSGIVGADRVQSAGSMHRVTELIDRNHATTDHRVLIVAHGDASV